MDSVADTDVLVERHEDQFGFKFVMTPDGRPQPTSLHPQLAIPNVRRLEAKSGQQLISLPLSGSVKPASSRDFAATAERDFDVEKDAPFGLRRDAVLLQTAAQGAHFSRELTAPSTFRRFSVQHVVDPGCA